MKITLVLPFVALSLIAVPALAVPVNLTMDFYGQVNQTAVYRGDIAAAIFGIGSINIARLTDNFSYRGSTGVFTGFDADFLFFDSDGDLGTDNDRIYPVLDETTFVTPGVVDNPTGSAYQPTALHPGPLFGLLDGSGAIDHNTATLDTLDASYVPGVPGLTVDGSGGWVTLGDGGQLTAAFPRFTISQFHSMYLFIGDSGSPQEAMAANAEIEFFDEFQLVFVSPYMNAVYLGAGQSVNLDCSWISPLYGPEAYYWWDLDGDGEYDDAVGQSPIVSFDYLLNTLGLNLGPNVVSLMVSEDRSESEDIYNVPIILPEPGTFALLSLGTCLAMLRKRRRHTCER